LQDNVVSCILCSTHTSAVDRRLQVEIACNRRIIWFQRGNHILLVYCALLELHEALKCIKWSVWANCNRYLHQQKLFLLLQDLW